MFTLQPEQLWLIEDATKVQTCPVPKLTSLQGMLSGVLRLVGWDLFLMGATEIKVGFGEGRGAGRGGCCCLGQSRRAHTRRGPARPLPWHLPALVGSALPTGSGPQGSLGGEADFVAKGLHFRREMVCGRLCVAEGFVRGMCSNHHSFCGSPGQAPGEDARTEVEKPLWGLPSPCTRTLQPPTSLLPRVCPSVACRSAESLGAAS